jgi:hypothetical protein
MSPGWQILPEQTQILAVHAALLPTGESGQVLLLGGNEHDHNQAIDPKDKPNTVSKKQDIQQEKVRLYDVDSKKISALKGPRMDVFCCGHAYTGDGYLVIGGGTRFWESGEMGHDHLLGGDKALAEGEEHVDGFAGETQCYLFNHDTKRWSKFGEFGKDTQNDLKGRWYPTLLTLPTGNIIALSGQDKKEGTMVLPRIIPNPEISLELSSTVRWNWQNTLGENPEVPMYPRAFVLSDGSIFVGAVKKEGGKPEFGRYILGNKTYQYETLIKSEGQWDDAMQEHYKYASTLLPILPKESKNNRDRLLLTNGPKIYVAFPWNNHIMEIPDNISHRYHACATLLPNGLVFLNGGIAAKEHNGTDDLAVKKSEIFDPGIDWAKGKYNDANAKLTTVEKESEVARNYHSVALLLPDGTVFTAGSSKNGASGPSNEKAEMHIELFAPDYMGVANRLKINKISDDTGKEIKSVLLKSGSKVFFIECDEPERVKGVTLVRFGTSTHAGNFDQRVIVVPFSIESKKIKADLSNISVNVLPPGWYMCWLIDQGNNPCEKSSFLHLKNE